MRREMKHRPNERLLEQEFLSREESIQKINPAKLKIFSNSNNSDQIANTGHFSALQPQDADRIRREYLQRYAHSNPNH